MLLFSMDVVSVVYWRSVYESYAKWANDRDEKRLPYISYKEYADAQARANCFVLSKDRPWTISNYIARVIQKVFL